MSEHGGASDDPFRNLPPMLRELARQLSQQQGGGWEMTRQFAVNVATDGQWEPNIDPTDRFEIEQLARVAELQIGTATGLSTSVTGRSLTIIPVNRTQWVYRTIEDYRPLLEVLGSSLHDTTDSFEAESDDPFAWLAPLMQMFGPTLLALVAGTMVGHLARRALGQYELPIPRPPEDELQLVLPNLDKFGSDWSLPQQDVRLWVCLHEVAHHAVLGLPHVRSHLDKLLRTYLSAFETSTISLDEQFSHLDVSDPAALASLPDRFGDPDLLLGVIQSPTQRELLPQLEAVVAAIVGYVDYVMDQVGSSLITSYSMVAEALRRRRVEAAPSDRFVERLFGLEMSQATYDRGERFVHGVVERAGENGLARLWESERTLPTPAEIEAPGLWLARIDLPED
ncbi:MAG: zinc-dependent metalloprotease [Acidimicrobiales bacterium]|nr:zinc-dependent metalloprotease [Acidimicrobiales bacterium]